MSEGRIYTGADKKVVGIDNKPIPTDEERARKEQIVAGLREMADKIEKGELTAPDSVICLPMMGGEVPVIVLGEQLPLIYVEGLFHRLATKMAFGQ